jgi:hypothetical protein
MTYRERAEFEREFFDAISEAFQVDVLKIVCDSHSAEAHSFRDVCKEPVTLFEITRRSQHRSEGVDRKRCKT